MEFSATMGRTTRAMASAPHGAAYVGPSRTWCHVVGKELAASVERPDLVLIGADELLERPFRFIGFEFGGVVVDHAVSLGKPHRPAFEYLRARARQRGGAGMADNDQRIAL